MKTKSFWIAAIMTLICSVAGVLLAKLPYVNLIGALVIAFYAVLPCVDSASLRNEAQGGIGFISNNFWLGIILLGFA